jgi:hypothetical protein
LHEEFRGFHGVIRISGKGVVPFMHPIVYLYEAWLKQGSSRPSMVYKVLTVNVVCFRISSPRF